MKPILLWAAAACLAAGQTIQVKPGDDLAAALAKARTLRAENPDGEITVLLTNGVHRLSAPLTLTEVDSGTESSPLRIHAAPGARPVISGGRPVAGWKVLPDGRWQTKMDDGAGFEQLWVNGRRAVRAREPDAGFFLLISVDEKQSGAGQAIQTITLGDQDLAALRKLSAQEAGRVQMLVYHKWDNTRRFLTGIEGNRITTSGRPMKPWNRWDAKTGVVFENFAAALDEPGEWFLAADGTLTYLPRPGETPATSKAVIPVTESLLRIEGKPGAPVRNIDIRGIAFRHAGWTCPPGGFEPAQAAAPIGAVIQADHAEKVSLTNCEVSATGVYGIWFREGCRNNRLQSCYLHDLGAGGVRIGSTGMGAKTGGNVVADCIIRDGGKVFPCAVGVWIGHSPDNAIEHNEISHFAYTGISVGWRWGYEQSEAKRNRIEFNHIHHIGDGLLSDMGGIYTLGPSEGTTLRHNRIHDIVSYAYGGWGLYNDEGSTGILMENNLVYRTTSGGYHQHYGRENIVRNNIFAFARDQQLQITRAEPHLSFRFTGNIVLWQKGPLWSGGGKQANIECDRNLLWPLDGQPVTCFGMSLDEWRKLGHDAASVISDPGFIDPAKGDFSFRDTRAVEQIGFKPFDTTAAGVRGDAAWKSLAREAP